MSCSSPEWQWVTQTWPMWHNAFPAWCLTPVSWLVHSSAPGHLIGQRGQLSHSLPGRSCWHSFTLETGQRQRTQPAAGQPALSWGQLLSLPGPVTRASLGQGHLSSVQDTLTWGPQHWGEMIQYGVLYFPIPSLSAGYEIIIKRNTGRNSYEMTKQCVHKFQNYKTRKWRISLSTLIYILCLISSFFLKGISLAGQNCRTVLANQRGAGGW